MEGPDFLNRKFCLRLQPSYVLLNSLTEMSRLSNWAMLVVTGTHRIQIVAFSGNGGHGACAMLEMSCHYIDAPSDSDGYSLHFRLDNWLQLLSDPIAQETSPLLTIVKDSESLDLYCSFGNGQRTVQLGDAEFFRTPGVYVNNFQCDVRLTMSAEQFRDLIQDFSTKHYFPLSAVEMLISRDNIRFNTPSLGSFDYSAAEYSVTGLGDNISFKFGLTWDLTLFQRLSWLSLRWEFVELSVFQIYMQVKVYLIRFFMGGQSYEFSFIPRMLFNLCE